MINSAIKMGNSSPAWGGLEGIPKSITLCVTEDCNLACKYCYMIGKNHTKKMNFETAKKVIDYVLSERDLFREKSVVWEFIGGEAFVEIELVDKITDYIKQQMFLLDHPWFNSYRLSFSSNGLLYHTRPVQTYIQKNKHHLSIGFSVDGNKIKHDLQRVKADGSGSYDDVVKNVPLWLSQFPGAATKATFTHDDIPYLKDSIISLWDIGIHNVSANVVFEDVWEEDDDLLLEEQLKELADYTLENELWKSCSVRFFDPYIGNPLSEEEKNRNFCGAGRMLAIDCEGNFFPCQRFYGFSLQKQKEFTIGNVDTGINEDRLRPFQALSLKSQSPMECITCKVASGCAWCTGFNYDMADTVTIYQRATDICKMHKATVRANKYFWNKFEEMTGIPSERHRFEDKSVHGQQFLQFITSDDITPHCAYRNKKGTTNKMPTEIVLNGLEFCKTNDLTPAFLGIPDADINIPDYFVINKAGEEDNVISVFDNHSNCTKEEDTAILLLNKQNITNLYHLIRTLFSKVQRINLIQEDIEDWTKENVDSYQKQLDLIITFLAEEYRQGREPELNCITDIWNLDSMSNCDAGTGSFALAPNGKIYVCPAYYFEDEDNSIGDLRNGINIKNPQLLMLENAPICSSCDVYNCNRCKYLNEKLTNELNTPSKIQCLISHIEREHARKLQELMRGYEYEFENHLKKLDYNDPLEKLLKL